MMTQKLLPLIVLTLFIFTSCGSDSEKADINKEWILIDLKYSGESTKEGEIAMFDGQLIDGVASIQFDEEPNVVRSKGMYNIQFESKEDDIVRIGSQEVSFKEFGSWMKYGNVISTTAENNFETDLLIQNLSDDKLNLKFRYTENVDFFGSPKASNVNGMFFLASPEYINTWKERIKGGWVLTDIDLIQYGGSNLQMEGVVDEKSTGIYAESDAPLQFGDSGKFLASGSYSAKVKRTQYVSTGQDLESTSTKFYRFLRDGSYAIDGRVCTITTNGGEIRTLNIIDITEETLTLFESIAGNNIGSNEQLDSRSGIKYTMTRKDYKASFEGLILGDWKLSGFDSELFEDVYLGSDLKNKSSTKAELISSTSKIFVSEDPYKITRFGTFKIRVTETDAGIETVEEKTKNAFGATKWSISGNELQVYFSGSHRTFIIESMSEVEMVLKENLDNTIEASGYTFKTTGYNKFTFIR